MPLIGILGGAGLSLHLHRKLILLLCSAWLGSSLKGALSVILQGWEMPLPFARRRSPKCKTAWRISAQPLPLEVKNTVLGIE